MMKQLIVKCPLSGPYQRVNNVSSYFHLSFLCLTPHRCKVNPGCCCISTVLFLGKTIPVSSLLFIFCFFFVLIFLSMFSCVCKTLVKRALWWASVLRMDVQVQAVQLRVNRKTGNVFFLGFKSLFFPLMLSSYIKAFFSTEFTWFEGPS